MGFLSSIFGGGGSSSSSTKSTTTNTNAPVSVAAEEGHAFNLNSETGTVNLDMLDGGSIESAFDFARLTYEKAEENFATVVGLTEKNIDAVQTTAKSFAETTKEAFATANQKAEPLDPNKALLLIAVVGGGLLYFSKKGGSA